MSEEISKELAQLEACGRVRARDQRPVHGDFGFASIAASPLRSQSNEHEPPAPASIVSELDQAWARLRRTADPS